MVAGKGGLREVVRVRRAFGQEKRRLKRCGKKGGLGEGWSGGKVGEKARLREVKEKY